nr:Retrovirus-related Pol polyprotein from transposon TNT 1-94 [Ipomoea batatas]
MRIPAVMKKTPPEAVSGGEDEGHMVPNILKPVKAGFLVSKFCVISSRIVARHSILRPKSIKSKYPTNGTYDGSRIHLPRVSLLIPFSLSSLPPPPPSFPSCGALRSFSLFLSPHVSFAFILQHQMDGEFNQLPDSSSSNHVVGKDEYLTGEIVKPKEIDATYWQWKYENHMAMSWLINSMLHEIGENFLRYCIAKEIWDGAHDTYSSS